LRLQPHQPGVKVWGTVRAGLASKI
jgi:hypothetical protein